MHIPFRNKKENGRTLVEMTGVLFVIGLLSMGTIGTFKFAIDYFRANSIIAETRLRLLALSRRGASKDAEKSLQTLKSFWKKPNQDLIFEKYEVTLSQPDGQGPTLVISNLEPGICTRLKAKTGKECDEQNAIRFDLSLLDTSQE